MRRLIEYARERGIGEIFGHVLRENSSMLAICRLLGTRRRPILTIRRSTSSASAWAPLIIGGRSGGACRNAEVLANVADNVPVALADKVAFLGAAEAMLASVPRRSKRSRPTCPWVFLTDRFAYKLKYVATLVIDLRLLEARHRNCRWRSVSIAAMRPTCTSTPCTDLCTARRWSCGSAATAGSSSGWW